MAVSVASAPVAASSVIVRQYLIGTGFLCDLARPEKLACPAVSEAENGDTIEVTGEGTLRPAGDKADGGGTFVHKHHGKVLGRGTWEAVRLISFASYGSGSVQGLPEEFEGGLAVMSVRLTSESGLQFDAILAIDCALGSIPEGAAEGITLSIPDANLDFNEKLSGFTLFIMEG